MKIDELIYKIQNEFEKEYGLEGLVKIALAPKVFERVCEEFYTRQDMFGHIQNSFSLRDRGEFIILGVQIVSRDPRKEF